MFQRIWTYSGIPQAAILVLILMLLSHSRASTWPGELAITAAAPVPVTPTRVIDDCIVRVDPHNATDIASTSPHFRCRIVATPSGYIIEADRRSPP